MKKWDYQSVKEYIESEGYTLITTEYKNMNNQTLESLCPNGHKYNFKFKNFLLGRRCRECNKISKDDVVNKAEANNYVIVGDLAKWKGGKDTISVRCLNGHISNKRYDNLNQGCKECQNNSKRNDFEDVKKYIEETGYILLSDEYVNNTTPLELICPNHHNITITFSNFKNGQRCAECCFDNYRKSYEDVKSVVESRGYKLLSTEYKNIQEKLYLECSNGHRFYMSLAALYWGGNDCTLCNLSYVSKGEEAIVNFLDNNSIKYERQYTFDNCKDKRKLPFDFYISSINLIIEFDGQHHFMPKSKYRGEEGFIETLYHDCIKNQYCEDNNIKIIRIPYWELENIEKILTQHIILE